MNPHNPRPIVCGTDFSPAAAKAADAAAAMSVRLGAPLLLVHGIDERGEIPDAHWPAMTEPLRSQLHVEAERLRRAGVQLEEILTGGAPDDGVTVRAERANARFIVVGSEGHGAVGRWMLGSVSERIAESAWIPTLVLRHGARMEDWARGGKPLRVFICADFTSNSEAAMSWAAELRQIGHCEFTVGFVDQYAVERAIQRQRAAEGALPNPEVEDMLRYDLRQRALNYFPKDALQVRVLPTSGKVDEHLLDMASETGADLIVVGTHQWRGISRLGHHSVSRRILHSAHINVACVPSRRVISATSSCVFNVDRVLVAADLDTHGGNAIRYAFSMLRPGGAVSLLHVQSPGADSGACVARLEELIPVEAIERGFKVETEVVEDVDPAKAICDTAERLNVDVICVGSRGPCNRPEALGLTTLAILTRSRRPVLVVPQQSSA